VYCIDSVGELRQLQRLIISGNKINNLPGTIGNLQQLTILDIKTNEVSDLPPELGKLQALTKFDMSHNMVTELPWEMGQLANLGTLDVTHNPLIIPPKPVTVRGTSATIAWLKANEKAGRKAKVSGLGLKSQNE
jgi:Leucine-rich repeat (LRR) protein